MPRLDSFRFLTTVESAIPSLFNAFLLQGFAHRTQLSGRLFFGQPQETDATPVQTSEIEYFSVEKTNSLERVKRKSALGASKIKLIQSQDENV